MDLILPNMDGWEATRQIKADAATPPPFMSMTMDAARYYALIGDAMMLESADNEDEMPQETREAMRDLMVSVGEIYDRINLDVRFTARGVELDSVLVLAD